MGIALTGLVVLQYTWIKEAISTKEAQFDHNVNDVLQKISHKIEKIEAAELMLNHYKKTNPINFINQVTAIDTQKATTNATHRVQYTQTIQQITVVCKFRLLLIRQQIMKKRLFL